MLERAQTKVLPLLGRVDDYAPATQACCGVCRTCATTNVLALAGAALVAVASRARRLRPRG